MMRLRTPRSKTSFSVKDIQDLDVETPELEIIPEATEQKRSKLLDDIDGGKVKSTNELHGTNKDGGGRVEVYSRKLGEGQPAKISLQLQKVDFLDCITTVAVHTFYSNALACRIRCCASPWNSSKITSTNIRCLVSGRFR